MRKVVASIFVTVDGVMEDPGGAEGFDLGGWSFKYGGCSDDDLQHAGDLLRASDALLLGRVTYEGFAKAWPGMEGGGWYADRMNSLPKYVVEVRQVFGPDDYAGLIPNEPSPPIGIQT